MKSRKRNITANSFIDNADTEHTTDKAIKETRKVKKYKVLSFSLDSEIDNKINSLSIKSRKFRTSKSDIIRIAINLLENQNDDVFESLVEKEKL